MSAFNEEATIVRAVERVLAAEYPVEDVELVLVENGSTDGTRAAIAAATGRLRCASSTWITTAARGTG